MITFKNFILCENFLNKKEIQNKINQIINSSVLKNVNSDKTNYIDIDEKSNIVNIYIGERNNLSKELKQTLINAVTYYLKDLGCIIENGYVDPTEPYSYKIKIISYPKFDSNDHWKNVTNPEAKKRLYNGQAIDIVDIGIETEPGVWKLNKFIDDTDFYDTKNNKWIWSIGKDKNTGEIFASVDARFYDPNNEDFEYETIWLR